MTASILDAIGNTPLIGLGRIGRLRLPRLQRGGSGLLFDLVEHEGLCLGGSTGIDVAGTMALARKLGPGHTIVTVLCDGGVRYASKLYNPAFLRTRGLPVSA